MEQQQPNPLKSLLSRLIFACQDIHMEKPRALVITGLQKVVEDAEFLAKVERGKREKRSRNFRAQQQRLRQRQQVEVNDEKV